MPSEITFYLAQEDDLEDLSTFLSFEYFVHRHLDWRTSLDWLGRQPFWIAKANDEIIACFCAVPEFEQVAWIRLFACSALYSKNLLWQEFFQRSLKQLSSQVKLIAALGTENWFINLMEYANFEISQRIIVFEWEPQLVEDIPLPPGYVLRNFDHQDIEQVHSLDKLCFSPLWQMSQEAMGLALDQSGYATLIETNHQIIAYQITTESLSSAHLARIAVHPNHQGKKLGKCILHNLLSTYAVQGIRRITVNTQNDNLKSQALYRQSGFVLTEEQYPVYTYFLK